MVGVVGEDECVIDVDKDICCFGRVISVEETVVEAGHRAPFCAEGGAIVLIEYTAGVGEAV